MRKGQPLAQLAFLDSRTLVVLADSFHEAEEHLHVILVELLPRILLTLRQFAGGRRGLETSALIVLVLEDPLQQVKVRLPSVTEAVEGVGEIGDE